MRTLAMTVLLLAAAAAPALGQNADTNKYLSPYAGEESRRIKALAPETVDDLLAGRGAGYAKAAELNGLPGPTHVLEMKDELGLSADQEKRMKALLDRMTGQAKRLGAELVDLETELNDDFAASRITPGQLRYLLDRIASVESDLRYTHLYAHLETPEILTAEQIQAYNRLRGYGGDPCASVPAGHDPEMWRRHNNCPE